MSRSIATPIVEKAPGTRALALRWDSLLLPLVVGGLVRLIGLDRLSIWLDEATSIMLSKDPVATILTDTSDSHPPLYHLILHYWLMAGDAAWWVRGLSAIMGILTIAALYGFVRELFGRQAGPIAAWLLALSPWHVWYSQEARMYAAACLLGTLSLLGGALLLRRNLLFVLIYLPVTVAGLWTEYTFFLLWPAEIVLLLWFCRAKLKPANTVVFLLSQIVVAATLLPLAPFYQKHLSLFLSPEFIRARSGVFGDNLLLVAVGLAALGLLALGAFVLLNRLKPRLGENLSLLGLLLLLPITFAIMLFPGAFVAKRALLIVLPLLITGIAWSISRAQWPQINLRNAALASAAALVLMVVTLQKEQWSDVVALLRSNSQPGDVFLIEASYMSRPFYYYAQVQFPLIELTANSGNAQLAEQITGHQRAWLILSQDNLTDPNANVRRWFDQQFKLQQSLDYYQIKVRLYDVTSGQ